MALSLLCRMLEHKEIKKLSLLAVEYGDWPGGLTPIKFAQKLNTKCLLKSLERPMEFKTWGHRQQYHLPNNEVMSLWSSVRVFDGDFF